MYWYQHKYLKSNIFLFALVWIINNVSYFLLFDSSSSYATFSFTTRIISSCLCLLLIWLEISNYKYKKIIWYCTIIYSLPFFFGMMILRSDFSTYWLMNFISAAFFTVILLNLSDAIVCFIIGLLGVFIVRYITKEEYYFISEILEFKDFLATLIVPFIIGAIFLIRKEDITKDKISTLEIFSSAIAHEVLGPLTLIEKQATLIKQAAESQDYNKVIQSAVILKQIGASGKQEAEIILTNIKELEKTYNIDDYQESYSVIEIINTAIKEYKMTESELARIHLRHEHDFKLKGSKHLLKYVIFNLLNNAFKYAGDRAKIEIWVINNEIHFKDSGYGIRSEYLAKIFDKFYSGDQSGTGIGLSFCQTVIERMGGNIICNSKYGEYTEFILTLPN